jgi:hypothetical protein
VPACFNFFASSFSQAEILLEKQEPKKIECSSDNACILVVEKEGILYRTQWKKLSEGGFEIAVEDQAIDKEKQGPVSMIITNIDDVTEAINIIKVISSDSKDDSSFAGLSINEGSLLAVRNKGLGINFDISETEGNVYSGARFTQEQFFDGRLGLAVASHNFEGCADRRNCASESGAFVGLSFSVK